MEVVQAVISILFDLGQADLLGSLAEIISLIESLLSIIAILSTFLYFIYSHFFDHQAAVTKAETLIFILLKKKQLNNC